jgi:hypothetical protein
VRSTCALLCRAQYLQGGSFVTYPTEFVKTRSQFGGKVRSSLTGQPQAHGQN